MFTSLSFRAAGIMILLLAAGSYTIAQQQNKPVPVTNSTPTVNAVNGPYAADAKVNTVRTWDPMGPFTSVNDVLNASYLDVKQASSYVDGLGRPLQTVNRQITPLARDMVAPVMFDAYGREVYKYLPYVSSDDNGQFKYDPFNGQKKFMEAYYSGDEQVYYSQTNYEASPLNRVVKTMAAGNSWAGLGRGVEMNYLINTADDAVRIWKIGNGPLTYSQKDVSTNVPYNPVTPANPLYNAGELNKGVIIDEAGNATVEYKDKEGRVILKKVQIGNISPDYSGYTGFLCTYNVYDDYNELRFVIPPKAVAQLIANSWQFTDDIINELCFRYEYDSQGRMIAKKVPGADWVYMIYDVRDRLVFTQDGSMRSKNQWLTTLYDRLNRPVMTGMIIGYTGNAAALQGLVTSQKNEVVIPPGMVADLVLPNSGQAGPFSGTYRAYNSILLDIGFETTNSADFTAEIFTVGGDVPEESTVDGMAINKNPVPGSATFIALTKTYYDDYNWTNKAYTTNYNSHLDAGSNLHAVAMPAQAYAKTNGLVTGQKVRTITGPNNLAAGNWLTSVNFYDDRNRVIQVNSETHKGTDVITNLYDFTGKVLCTYLDHTNITGTPASLRVTTNMEYDHTGRLEEVWKTINDDASKKALIVKNEYNELGQLMKKELGHKKDDNGNYTTSQYDPLETLNYAYNIRGWLTGINKEYANDKPIPGGTDPWFGMELSYDKGFLVPQYNGNIAGTKWRSKGDGERRAFGYTYDQANRILGADFSQVIGGNYTEHPTIQFDMEMGNTGRKFPAYDENGNIGAMKHRGLKLGNSQVIDELVYDYHNGGNKLKYVKDWAADATGTVGGSWGLGDFTDNNPDNPNKNDYGYDVNGNMVVDLNKKLTGTPDIDQVGGAITYNHLNLPWKILVDGGNKGTITYTYDAAGVKLSKVVEDKSVAGRIVTTATTYIGGLVYESKATNPSDPANDYTDKLQLISHEEGRIRYIPAKDKVAAHFEYDYFVKDHLGNVRAVLTEENAHHEYMTTMERGADNKVRNVDNQIFSNLDASELLVTSVPEGYPYGNSAIEPNEYVARVNGKDNKKGPAVVLKVMVGDKLDFRVRYYYHDKTDPGKPGNVLADILSSLAGGIVNASGVTKGTLSDLSDPSASPLLGALNDFQKGNNPDMPGKPKAYLNWIMLDEQFNYVKSQSGAKPVERPEEVLSLIQPEITMEKNGYLYIYLGNETENWDVYFDDLKITHRPGALLEETHYYPFGLTMAGISSKVLNLAGNSADCGCGNKKLFNGNEIQNKEFIDGSGLELYDFNARTYDQQIGRFVQIDPTPEDGDQESLTPYHFSGNNPSTFNDPDGKCPWCIGALVAAAVEYGTQVVTNLASGKSLGKSLTEVSWGNVAVSATAGALSGGLSAFAPKGVAGKVVKEVVSTGIDAVESAVKQYNDNGKVSLVKVATDVLSNKVAGKLTDNVKSNSIKTAEKQLDRAQRIVKGDPTSSGRAATVKKLESNLNAQKAAKQVSSGATGNALQAGADAAVGGHKPAMPQYNPNKQVKDNTNVVRYLNF